MLGTVSHEAFRKALAGDRIVLEPFPLLPRLLVGVWLAMAVGIVSTATGWTNGGPGQAGAAALSLTAIAAAAYLPLAWRNRLTLKFGARAYDWERGLYPFVRRQWGSLDEFDHLALAIQTGTTGHGGTYSFWTLRLAWKADAPRAGGDRLPPGALPGVALSHGTDDPDVVALAHTLAGRMGLPLRGASPSCERAIAWHRERHGGRAE